MNTVEIVLLVIVVIGSSIYRQVRGEMLRGKRVVLLPAILAVIGAVDLGHTAHLNLADAVCIGASAVVAIAIGLAQGTVMRLESRGGSLWGRLPTKGVWLWVGLIATRLVAAGIAVPLHAHAVTSTDSILLVLGLNRLAQAAVVVLRAIRMGVPFAPEKDGRIFLGELFNRASADRTPEAPVAPSRWSATGSGFAGPARGSATMIDVAGRVTDRS